MEIVPAERVAGWRPLIVDYLNRNRGGERRGDQLETILSAPVTYDSWWCWQNVCVAIVWVSLVASLILGVASVALFVVNRRDRSTFVSV
jgi:hypothetical protein